MIRSLRAFFLSRALREKLLLVAFLGIGVVMWATAFSTRAGRFTRAVGTTTATLKDQDAWLARRDEIETATRQAASEMDPAKTLDATGLAVTVNQLAKESGVNPTMGSPSTQSLGQFSMHELQFTAMNVEWDAFARLYERLTARAPYITTTELSLEPNRANPRQVRATVRVASFEIRR